MTIIKAEVKYGFDPSKPVTLRKWLSAGDTADKTGGSALEIYPEGYTLAGPASNANEWIAQFLTCLQEVMQPGVQVFSASAEQYSDGPVRTIIHTQSYVVAPFSAKTGNTPDSGPRGLKHLGGKQYVAATRKVGWLRWHLISGHIMSKPTVMAPSELGVRFEEYYGYLRNGASNMFPYYTITAALGTTPEFTTEGLPGSLIVQGIRNG